MNDETEEITVCDCCGEEIPQSEANDGTKFGYGTLCNECYAEASSEDE